MTAASPSKVGHLPETYGGLCRRFMPRPLHDEARLEQAIEMADTLAGHALNPDQADYLELISDLIEAYEDRLLPEVKLTPAEALAGLLEENGLDAGDLAQTLRVTRSLASKILRGERRLTVDHITALAKRFAVRADLFLA